MAISKKEEVVVTPAVTVESVVAQAAAEPVKAVDAEKEVKDTTPTAAPISEEANTNSTDEAPKAEEAAEASSSSDQDQDTSVATPVDASIPEWKEESNIVADLKESEKKALEEFKLRIEQAIKDGEFKVPKKVVTPSKEEETAVIAVASTEETTGEVAPVATDESLAAVEAKTSATPVTDSPAVTVENKAETTSAPAAPAVQLKAEEKVTRDPAEPKVEQSPAVVTEKKIETKAAPASAEKVEAKAAPAAAEKVETKAVVDTKAVPVVAEKDEVKAAPEVAGKVEEKTAVAEEVVEKKSGSEEVLVESNDDTKSPEAEVSRDAEAPPAEPEPEEEPEDTTPPEDISLWGVPLLYTKGDKRTDVVLLKFLRAREFNVKEAFKQLRNTIIWRKTFNADNLLNEEFGTELDGVAFMHGVSRDGQPVCYNVSGVFQDKELYQKTFGDAEKLNTFLRWRVQVLEKGIQLLKFTPEGPSSILQVSDLKNTPGLAKREFKAAANKAITLLQDNYPELSSKRVFVNVGKYASAAYTVISPILTKRAKSKIVYAPAGKTTECLLKFISADNIPVQYGGLSRLYDTEFTPGSALVNELVLKGGKSTQIEIEVTEVGSTVVWDLTVIGFDVTYGAEFIPSAEGSYTIIIQKSKKLPSTTEEPVRDRFKVTTPGKIVLTVANLSRKKKTILYRHNVKSVEPAAAAIESS